MIFINIKEVKCMSRVDYELLFLTCSFIALVVGLYFFCRAEAEEFLEKGEYRK